MARFRAGSAVRDGCVKIVIDMNLGKDWIDRLAANNHEAVHWSSVGNAAAPDGDIMDWASTNSHVVLTADLDFGTLLAASNAAAPSVIQLRTSNTLPDYAGPKVLFALRQAQIDIEEGALVTVDDDRFRVRPLPIHFSS
jgi:predicted nuclease of predicted toxin-antitoxin system